MTSYIFTIPRNALMDMNLDAIATATPNQLLFLLLLTTETHLYEIDDFVTEFNEEDTIDDKLYLRGVTLDDNQERILRDIYRARYAEDGTK